MKQSSVIFVIILLMTILHERETQMKTKNLIKEKVSPNLDKSLLETTAKLVSHQNAASTGDASTNTQNTSAYTNVNDQTVDNRNSGYENGNSIPNPKSQQSGNDDDPYSAQKNIECNESNCFYPYGRCVDNNTCQCTKEYASFKQEGEFEDHYCDYERKKQLVSFLLEFFFPFGVGHFYSGRILMGVLKIVVCFSQCIFAGLGFCFAQDAGMVLVILLLIFGCAYISWELVDIILIAMNVYKDGNGVPLASW
jgi:hypothetical protein